MSAQVLLNTFNKLGKSHKLRGLPSILSLFCNEFNNFNNTRARMLDSIYHMSLKLLKIAFLGYIRQYFVIFMQCSLRCALICITTTYKHIEGRNSVVHMKYNNTNLYSTRHTHKRVSTCLQCNCANQLGHMIQEDNQS